MNWCENKNKILNNINVNFNNERYYQNERDDSKSVNDTGTLVLTEILI